MRSMCFSIDNRSLTSSLVDTRDIALEAATVPSASFTNSIRYLLLLVASFPPFRRSPLALDMARAATWGRLSGRDSNITRRTPIGTVICLSSNPSANLVLLKTRPTFSKESSAICRRPALKDFNLPEERDNRESNAFARPVLLAASRSFALASRISFCRVSSKSASTLMQLARSSGRRACNVLLATRAVRRSRIEERASK